MTSRYCPECGRPLLLDNFAGEGGVGVGYQRAGFCTDAVDTSEARLAHYPTDCPRQQKIHGDAIAYTLEHGHKYAVRHGSPTCTGYSQSTAGLPDQLTRYDRLIPAVREAFLMVGGPYVIENVTSKATRAELRNPLMLCWTEFNTPGSVLDTDGTPLWMRRHRLFESNVPLLRAAGCAHPPRNKSAPGWVQCAGSYGGARRDKDEARYIRRGGYVPGSVDVQREMLGTPWMTQDGCKLSIPPVYTEHLGRQLLDHIARDAA